MITHIYYIYALQFLLLLSITRCSSIDGRCNFLKLPASGTAEKCANIPDREKTANLPMISGAYCYNNGSGICKAFAGRYEFYYDSFKDQFLRSASASKYVDEYGYHQRVPISYSVDGDILYADRSINWALDFVSTSSWNNKQISILSTETINWCAFVENQNWPYKSAIKFENYHIFFFNRQSCIYDTNTGDIQQFNTRFLHNSSVRIDLDMNPTIYAMEDNTVQQIRLIKHRRQHWYEVEFKVLAKPTPQLSYFVDMKPTDTKPCKICGNRPILPGDGYRPFSNVCLSDFFHTRPDQNNAQLVEEYCGLDKTEIADLPLPIYKSPGQLGQTVHEVDLHNIPRRPGVTTSFFGVNIRNDADWVIFAKDGLTFSAATTIPIEGSPNSVRVIMLYAKFKIGGQENKYEEHDPMPYLADYTATFKGTTNENGKWEYDRDKASVVAKTLNYVDDIAYLYQCKSLLVIFGPLYSELPIDEPITLETKGFIRSIYDLGIWEPVNAFFASPDGSDSLWVYFRTNFIAEFKYKCTKPIVTAQMANGRYLLRHGPSAPGKFSYYQNPNLEITEEAFFKHLGVFKGNANPIEAPDPKLYKGASIGPPKPELEKDQSYIYIIIAVGVLLIVTMCIICMIAVRRRIKRRHHERALKTTRSSNLHDGSEAKSARSILSWLPFGGPSTIGLNKTRRSAMSAHSPSSHSKRSSRLPSTVRSARTPTVPGGTVRSPSLTSNHGSGASSSHRSGASSHASSHKPSSHSKTTRSWKVA